VITGKVWRSFVGETDFAKLLAPAHLHFATMGW